MRTRDLTDRLILLVVGLGLVAGGLTLVDWQQGRVLDLRPTLDTTAALDAVDAGWWRWAEGGAGVVVALLALVWLLAHLPRRGPATAVLPGSDATGELSVDLGALGRVLAEQLEDAGTLDHARVGATRRGRSGATTLTATARLAADADLPSVVDTAAGVRRDIERALPDAGVHLQVRLGAPRHDRPVRSGRRATVRLQ